jgi:hypothetical protein
MRTLTKFLAVASVATSLTVFAAPSQAGTPIASTVDIDQAADFTWTNNGVTGAGAGGTLVGSAAGINPLGDNFFTFLLPSLSGLGFLPADFSLTATSTAGPATQAPGPGTWTQTGLSGSFSYLYAGSNVTIGSISLTTGENLLSGVFTNAWIQGAGASGSTNLSIGNGGSACFTSALFATACGPTDGSEFAFNMLNVAPGFGAAPDQGLTSFTAYGNGTFSIPEPGTWALMIMGFGGAGAVLRQRRRVVALAA